MLAVSVVVFTAVLINHERSKHSEMYSVIDARRFELVVLIYRLSQKHRGDTFKASYY